MHFFLKMSQIIKVMHELTYRGKHVRLVCTFEHSAKRFLLIAMHSSAFKEPAKKRMIVNTNIEDS